MLSQKIDSFFFYGKKVVRMVTGDIEKQCYICYGGNEMSFAVSPCACKGSIQIHKQCLQDNWNIGNKRCMICKELYVPQKMYSNGLELIVKIDTYGQKSMYTIDSSNEKHGMYREWHSNGILKISCNYEHGNYDGLYQQWYTNGYLFNVRNYVNGRVHGVDIYMFPNGKPKAKIHYTNGIMKDSIARSWYDNGQLQEVYTKMNGHYEGIEQVWHKNGQIQAQVTYMNYKKIGRVKLWSSDGSPTVSMLDIYTYN
jgi:antitoxin component YwqK of YwqJK toxin-antitoxin module